MSAPLFSFRSPRELASAAGAELPSESIATMLDAAYRVPPTPEQRKLFAKLAPRRWFMSARWPDASAPVRLVAACLGRRGLKTTGLLAWMTAFEALCVESHGQHAAPGSRVYFVVIAPRQAQAREALRAVRGVLDRLSSLGVSYQLRDAAGTPEIVIVNPTSSVERVISIMTADAVAVRGFAIAFVAFDEAGFFPAEEWNSTTDRDIWRAVAPAMVQFPDAKALFVSSPGAPRGLFHQHVTKPPKGALVFRAPSFVTNGRITEAQCRELAGDDATFEQEFNVSRFGYNGETFIDAQLARACIDEEGTVTPKGSRNLASSGVVAVDAASTGDDCAFGVGFTYARTISESSAAIREFIVERIETWQSSRDRPNTIDAIADHAAALSNAYGGLPIVADNRSFADLAHRLATRHGFRVVREADDGERLKAIARGGRIVVERPMNPQAQTMRWRSLRDAVLGRRLFLPAGEQGEKCARQIGQLRAETLTSGWLRVEARKDDAADVCALLVEATEARAPFASDGNESRWVTDGEYFQHGVGLVQLNGRWVRPDGMPGTIPRSHPDFWFKCREAVAAGHRAEPWWTAVGELAKKPIPEESDFRAFLDSDLGRAPYHGDRVRPEELITSFDQIDPMFWLKKKLPRM